MFSEKTIINYMNSAFCYIQYLLNLFLMFFFVMLMKLLNFYWIVIKQITMNMTGSPIKNLFFIRYVVDYALSVEKY